MAAAVALAAACLTPTPANADEHRPKRPASCTMTVQRDGDYRISFTASPVAEGERPIAEYRYREVGYARPFVSLFRENFSDVWPYAVHSDSPQFAVRALWSDKTHSRPRLCV